MHRYCNWIPQTASVAIITWTSGRCNKNRPAVAADHTPASDSPDAPGKSSRPSIGIPNPSSNQRPKSIWRQRSQQKGIDAEYSDSKRFSHCGQVTNGMAVEQYKAQQDQRKVQIRLLERPTFKRSVAIANRNFPRSSTADGSAAIYSFFFALESDDVDLALSGFLVLSFPSDDFDSLDFF